MSPPPNLTGQFGDTTYTKVFVGGLAWETQRETMRKYFEQFGEILEAVVITDKNTGRSKGYGFVTFQEPEAAMRACVDASPVIDGRRANCNLASLGVQRTRPPTPIHGGGGRRNTRVMKAAFNATTITSTGMIQQAVGPSGVGTAFPTPATTAPTFPHYAIQHGIPSYNLYGYSPYSTDYNYPMSYYNVYGGGATQYPMYGSATGVVTPGTAAFYPYFQFGQTGGAAYAHNQGYGAAVQYPHMYPYSAMASTTGTSGFTQQYGGPMSFATSPTQAGMTMALTTPTLPETPTPPPPHHHYRLISTPFTTPTASEQPLA
ncbi:hypothetical protein QJS10_CPA02g00792 [Acorus calamus]|uniref:RRM domain-containing protein n=1 Tax=Acorus calamus TaxID=4465 RepID=A0AAV9FBE4_ACOCL|nr:hypothetical protein QJS10_CPA02g00792 [Acorus calamus]